MLYNKNFVNESYEEYFDTTSRKYWSVKNLDLDIDVKNTINQMANWISRDIILPDLNQFIYNEDIYYVNEDGIVFVRVNVGPRFHHNYENKQVFFQVSNGSIINLEIYYDQDPYHYYTIDKQNSHIQKLTMIRQPYEFVTKGGGMRYITTINPIFITK